MLCFKPAIQYTIYEYVKKMVLAGRSVGRKQRGEATHAEQNLSAVEVFLLGMLARAVSTVVCFPYTRAKVMMQTKNQLTEIQNALCGNQQATANATTQGSRGA